jgi:hypothetical protein
VVIINTHKQPTLCTYVSNGSHNRTWLFQESALTDRVDNETQCVLCEVVFGFHNEKNTKLFSRYSDSLRDGRSEDRIAVGGEIFRTLPDRPWGPPNLLYNGYDSLSRG